ncbi:MAG: IS1/IS6 family transposase [Thaumarchaeota archaeon]|nr:IS1/IS6 family transposase [Nitrososphaerota archaeon]
MKETPKSQKNATKVIGPTRADRGRRIIENGGQIRRIDDIEYEVQSQTWPDRAYAVFHTERGWICSCPDHMEAGHQCKHIHAVEISIRMREAVQNGVTVKTVRPGQCKCGSANTAKYGIRHLKKGDIQEYRCRDCGKRFTHNLGFENKRATPEQISQAVELVFAGMSTRKTATFLKKMNVKVSHVTVFNWATQYGKLMERYADTIAPNVGEQWRTDEVYVSVKGNQRYLFAMLDTETRYWIAKMVSENKGTDDVKPMFEKARHITGKVPQTLVSDKAANFHEAWRDLYAPRNYLQKQTTHINQVEFDGVHHNNQMESFNGATIRHREKVTRGLKRDDSAIIAGLQVYHNHIRPHLSLDGQTPGEAAGIRIEGNDKILTLIQAAAKSAA